MNILFVCNRGLHRSRTAAEMFSDEHETGYGGIYANAVTAEQVEAADVVLVMEDHQREYLTEEFPNLCAGKRIVSLGIPDLYAYRQPELCALLQERVRPIVESR